MRSISQARRETTAMHEALLAIAEAAAGLDHGVDWTHILERVRASPMLYPRDALPVVTDPGVSHEQISSEAMAAGHLHEWAEAYTQHGCAAGARVAVARGLPSARSWGAWTIALAISSAHSSLLSAWSVLKEDRAPWWDSEVHDFWARRSVIVLSQTSVARDVLAALS